MPLAKCPRCQTLWNRDSGQPVCPACLPEETRERDIVRDFLNLNPGLDAEAVAEKTGVDIKTIHRMLADGQIARESELGQAVCGQCGAPAISHKQRLCEECLRKLNSKVMETRRNILGGKDDSQSLTAHEILQMKRR